MTSRRRTASANARLTPSRANGLRNSLIVAPSRGAGGEDGCERRGVLVELCRLVFEIGPALGGDAIVSRAPVFCGEPPIRREEAPLLHAMDRLHERTILDSEAAGGTFFEPQNNFEGVHRTPRQGFQHQNVERSANELHLVGHMLPPKILLREASVDDASVNGTAPLGRKGLTVQFS